MGSCAIQKLAAIQETRFRRCRKLSTPVVSHFKPAFRIVLPLLESRISESAGSSFLKKLGSRILVSRIHAFRF